MQMKLYGLLLLAVIQTARVSWAQTPPATRHPVYEDPTYEEIVQRSKDATPATNQNAKKLKQLGLAALYFAQAHKWKFAFTAQSFPKALKHYAKDGSIFYADDKKQQLFAFNPSLAGIDFDNLSSPSKTVMFYQGKDRKLNFVYKGYGLVCFGDGHVGLVSKEEAKKLQWKPEIKKK